MSRTRAPGSSATPSSRSYRWVLHVAVLAVALGAVLAGVRGRLTSDSDSGGWQRPPAAERSSLATLDATAEGTLVPSPAAPPTASVTPAPTPEPAPMPAVPTPVEQVTPTVMPAPSPEATPALAPSPSPPTVPPPRPARQPTAATRTPPRPSVVAQALQTASLRSAPGIEAPITGYVPPGATVTVVGCAAGCAWLLVAVSGGSAWTARHFWAVSGDVSRIGGQ